MNIYSVVIGCSVLLQTISAVLAVSLLIRPGRRIAGLVILTAISLMAFRRVISLWRALTENAARTDLPAELVALIISLLFLIGILYITRLIKAQEKTATTLQDSEERYHTVFSQSPDGILLIDTDGKIIDFNEAAHSRLGYSREEFAKLSLSDMDSDDSHEKIQACIKKVLTEGKTEFEVRQRTKHGEIRDINVNSRTVTLSGRTFFHTICRDLTEQKRAAEALRESQKLLETIFAAAPTCIKLITADGSLQSMNRAGLDMIEADSLDQVKDRCVYPLVSDKYRAAFQDLAQAVFKGESRTLEFKMIGLKGKPLWLYTHAVPLRDEKGEIVLALATTIDITERKQLEEELLASESLYRNLVETTAAVAWEVDLTTLRFKYISPQIMNKCGFPAELWTDYNYWLERVHPDDRENAASYCQAETAKGWDHAFEYRMITADNSIIWVRDVVSVIKENGKAVSLRGYLFDITERKITEEKVRQNEEFIRNILDTVDEGFIVVARDLRIMTANKAYCGQVCLPLDEVIGKHCYKVSHETDRPCYEDGEECAVQHVFETGEPHTALHRHADAERGILYVETRAYPLRDVSGNVTAVIETINNITEKHLLEKERLKTQKLESIGLLAGGIAHDFNNLLQGVFGYISMVKVHLTQKEKALEMLQQAEMALHMSVNLTSQLLTFSKGGMPVKKKLALCPLIENSVKFALSGSRIDYTLKCEQALWMVEADEGQLGQVIQNIVLNADQAMPMGGAIQVSVKMVRMPAKGLSARLPEGNYVEISVTDNGIGIPEQYLSRIFDPYFTTKDKGSGLGLATSYSIIKNHGGLIDVKSKPGEGTTFSVYLPAIELEEDKAETVPETKAVVRKGRILLMDDEELLRNIVGVMMTSLGHEVELTENGDEAVAKYREALQAGRRFDAVILDLTIRGGKGGEATLRELLALDPAVKAVVSSGYSDSSAIAEYESRGFRACLTKPYTVDALRDMLNVLLALS